MYIALNDGGSDGRLMGGATMRRQNKRLADANNRMSRDLKAAAKIQESFLPRNLPRVPGADFA